MSVFCLYLIKLCVLKMAIFAAGGFTSVETANPGAYHEG